MKKLYCLFVVVFVLIICVGCGGLVGYSQDKENKKLQTESFSFGGNTLSIDLPTGMRDDSKNAERKIKSDQRLMSVMDDMFIRSFAASEKMIAINCYRYDIKKIEKLTGESFPKIDLVEAVKGGMNGTINTAGIKKHREGKIITRKVNNIDIAEGTIYCVFKSKNGSDSPEIAYRNVSFAKGNDLWSLILMYYVKNEKDKQETDKIVDSMRWSEIK